MEEDDGAQPPAGYDPGAYPPFAVTVDVVVLTIRDRRLHVVLVQRKGDPYAGAWALPGGFVHADEDLGAAAVRELREETGVDAAAFLEQFRAYGAPRRDPRMRVVTVAYLAFLRDVPPPRAGSDAAAAELVPVFDVLGSDAVPLAFDHRTILEDGIAAARAQLESTSLAAALVGPEFTMRDLRGVYEAAWGVRLDPANFRRKVLASEGFVRPTGRRRTPTPSGGKPAEVYRAPDDVVALEHPLRVRSFGPVDALDDVEPRAVAPAALAAPREATGALPATDHVETASGAAPPPSRWVDRLLSGRRARLGEALTPASRFAAVGEAVDPDDAEVRARTEQLLAAMLKEHSVELSAALPEAAAAEDETAVARRAVDASGGDASVGVVRSRWVRREARARDTHELPFVADRAGAVWRIRAWDDAAVQEAMLDAGVVAIGGDELGDLSSRPPDAVIAAQLRGALPDRNDRAIATFVRYWRQLLDEMAVGDVVLVPLVGRRIAIGTVLGPYQYRADAARPELRHTRPVDWVAVVGRDALDPELRASIDAPGTIGRVRVPDAAGRVFAVLRAAGPLASEGDA